MLTPTQIEARKQGIGGSDAASLLGLNPYCTPYQLWLEKTGQAKQEEISSNDLRHIGHVLEAGIAQLFSDMTKLALEEVPQTLQHPKYPWMLCHLDRKVVTKNQIVECKNVSERSFKVYQWGEEGSDQIPLHYLVQVQHQLAVTGYSLAYVAALVGGNRLLRFEINRDEELINRLIEKEHYFWHEHVLMRKPPDPYNRIDISLLYPQDNGDYKEATEEIVHVAKQLHEIKLTKRNLEQEEKNYNDQLALYIGKNSGIRFAGRPIVTFKATKRGYRVLKTIERNLYEFSH